MVDLIADISAEELEVFIQEADEQLQLLDEDLVILEREGVKPEILQEIFRAAHTLKGSSAMLGYEDMSRVAHVMETLLDKIRDGTQEVTTPVIDVLLHGLDTLKSLREQLVSDSDKSVDVRSVIAEVESVANCGVNTPSDEVNSTLSRDSVVLEKTKALLGEGCETYRVRVEVDKESSWPAVRCFQAAKELSRIGEVVESSPSMEKLETGEAGHNLELIIVSNSQPSVIEEIVATIPEIVRTEITVQRPEETSSKGGTPTASGQKSGAGQGETTGTSSQKISHVSQAVRVDVRLLDNLMNLVGEMVIDRNRIKQIGRDLESKYKEDEVVQSLGETSAHIMKVVNELQENVLSARMLRIGTVFNGFPRLVRDLAQKAKKKVDLVIEGQETELDRSIIEQVRDPLLHLLRNSVDHGIELPDQRSGAGKSETGLVNLSAHQEQNYIVIVVADDGKGIDAEKLRKAAVKKGVISADEAGHLTDAGTMDLIFISGMSTAKRVTDVSGRGVGMDVVKTNIEGLGGQVSIDSQPGKGTTFTLRLPLTLATTNGLMVSSAGINYVVPMSSLVEVLKLAQGDTKNVLNKEVIRVRDNVFPLLRLDRMFGHGEDGSQPSSEIIAVVVRVKDKMVGLAVDSVLEPQETVVKSLGKYIGNVQGIAGATILGDGRVALILDTATLVAEATATKHDA